MKYATLSTIYITPNFCVQAYFTLDLKSLNEFNYDK